MSANDAKKIKSKKPKKPFPEYPLFSGVKATEIAKDMAMCD